MKRFLHALAALWPEKRRGGSPPVPDTRIGILQHGAAVLRMDKILSECVDLPIRKFAKETVGAGALGELVRSDGGLKLLKRQQSKSANTQIRESATKPLLTIVILVFFMCLMAAKQVSAQAEPAAAAAIKSLQIGDTIPEELWHLPLQVVNHPEGKETITLNDYRGKLIILDFWATWCTSCIKTIRANIPLATEFNDEVLLLPVTTQDNVLLSQFFSNQEPFLSVHGDTSLFRFFPHQLVPHYAWLAPNGKVFAITSSSAVTRSSIYDALKNRRPDFAEKKDIDMSSPLFLAGFPTSGAAVGQFEIMVKGDVPGLPSGSWSGAYQDSLNRFTLTNISIKRASKILLRLIMTGYDNKKLIYSKYAKGVEEDLNTLFSYDLIMDAEANDLYSQALVRINELGPLEYRVTEQPMDCIVISAPQGYAFENNGRTDGAVIPTKRLFNQLNTLEPDGPLIIDETGMQYFSDMNLDSITSLQESLGLLRDRYGLDARKAIRNVEVCLVIIR